MATRTITLGEEAYQRLRALKEEGESFTVTVLRLTGRVPLTKLAGLLTESEAERVEAHIRASRARSRKRMERVAREVRT